MREITDNQEIVENLDASWIGEKVRVRTGETVIIEDVLIQITHMSGGSRLYFRNTKALPAIFSQDTGYWIIPGTPVEIIS